MMQETKFANESQILHGMRNRYDMIFLYILAVQLVTVIAVFAFGMDLMSKVYPVIDYIATIFNRADVITITEDDDYEDVDPSDLEADGGAEIAFEEDGDIETVVAAAGTSSSSSGDDEDRKKNQ